MSLGSSAVTTSLAREVIEGLRSIVESFGPSEYVTVDIQRWPGVDVICERKLSTC